MWEGDLWAIPKDKFSIGGASKTLKTIPPLRFRLASRGKIFYKILFCDQWFVWNYSSLYRVCSNNESMPSVAWHSCTVYTQFPWLNWVTVQANDTPTSSLLFWQPQIVCCPTWKHEMRQNCRRRECHGLLFKKHKQTRWSINFSIRKYKSWY